MITTPSTSANEASLHNVNVAYSDSHPTPARTIFSRGKCSLAKEISFIFSNSDNDTASPFEPSTKIPSSVVFPNCLIFSINLSHAISP